MTESQRWTLTRNLTCWVGLVMFAAGASIVPAHASVDAPLSDLQVGELQQTVDRYPDVFGGLWGDPSTHLVTIKLAPSAVASRQAEAMRLVDNVGSPTDPKNNTSPKNWHKRLIGPSLEVLKAVMARVTTVEPWAQDSSAARVKWYVDQKLGKVIVGVEGTTRSLESEARAALGNLAELAVAERPVLHDRWSDVQPYSAAIAYLQAEGPVRLASTLP